MAMAIRASFFQTLLVFLVIQSSFTLLISSSDLSSSHPKEILDLKEKIVEKLGFHDDDSFEVFGFDMRDALAGHTLVYNFNVEIDDDVRKIKLMDDVNRWEHVDLPMFGVEEPERLSEVNSLPILAPFQLAGPMEIWIQDANDMRISLPHDVNVGVLKKIILSDGVVVTVKGARSISLVHPIALSLPLNQTNNKFTSGLLTLAQRLRDASFTQKAPLISLCIVGPTSLSSSSSINKLKLSLLAPGHGELSSPSKTKTRDSLSPTQTPNTSNTIWPFASINASNTHLQGFESLLSFLLDPKAEKKGSFKLLKADVTAQTFVKLSFGVAKKLNERDHLGYNLPVWRTKPEKARVYYELLGSVDGEKIIPEKLIQVNPEEIEDTVAPNVLIPNMTLYESPMIHSYFNPFAL